MKYAILTLCLALVTPMAHANLELNHTLGKTAIDLTDAQYQAGKERNEAAKKWQQLMKAEAWQDTTTWISQAKAPAHGQG